MYMRGALEVRYGQILESKRAVKRKENTFLWFTTEPKCFLKLFEELSKTNIEKVYAPQNLNCLALMSAFNALGIPTLKKRLSLSKFNTLIRQIIQSKHSRYSLRSILQRVVRRVSYRELHTFRLICRLEKMYFQIFQFDSKRKQPIKSK